MVKPADKAKAKELRREAKEKALDVFLRQLQFVSNLAKVSPSVRSMDSQVDELTSPHRTLAL
jgi:hypothetical protein